MSWNVDMWLIFKKLLYLNDEHASVSPARRQHFLGAA